MGVFGKFHNNNEGPVFDPYESNDNEIRIATLDEDVLAEQRQRREQAKVNLPIVPRTRTHWYSRPWIGSGDYTNNRRGVFNDDFWFYMWLFDDNHSGDNSFFSSIGEGIGDFFSAIGDGISDIFNDIDSWF